MINKREANNFLMSTDEAVNKKNNKNLPIFLNQNQLLPVLAMLTAVLFWGGSFAAMRVAVKALNPWSVMWIRMMLALIPVLFVICKLPPIGYQKGDFKLLLSMVVFQPCMYFLFESYALRYTTSSQAGVIAAAVPLVVSIGAWLLLSEPIFLRTIAGIFLSITGVVCLTIFGRSDGIAVNPLLGNFLELCAMTSGALGLLMVKQLSRRYNPWLLTAFQIIAGSIFFSPGLYYLFHGTAVWDLSLIFSLLFLGFFASFSAFGLYNWGISRIPAAKASVFINLIPVIAVALGWILLDERLNLYQFLSAIVVILGVWLSQAAKEE